MSFPRYNSYRESGVAWLGEVPSHWTLRRLGNYFSERREKVSDKEFRPLSVTKNGVVPQLETAAKTDDGDNRKKVLSGDFVINSRSDRKGSSGMSSLDGSVSLINTVLQIRSGLKPGFANYMLRSIDFQNEYYRFGKGIVADLWSTNYSEMRNIVLPEPTEEEQDRINVFLDQELAKIDGLITVQQHLIELLEQKRQAIISHAVTKGIVSSVRLKPSGVQWLGDVPEHWEVRQLQDLTPRTRAIMYGIVLPGLNVNSGISIVKGGDVKPHRLRLDLLCRTTRQIEAPFARARLLPGDVVYSIRGSIGDAELVPDELSGANITQDVARVSPKQGINSIWLLHALKSLPVFAQLEQRATGATIRGINIYDLKRVRIPVPPPAEQVRLGVHLESALAKMTDLEKEASAGIKLLQERRAALISAAVTGKIDVRNAVRSNMRSTPMIEVSVA